MKESTRARVAAIVGAAAGKKNVGHVYDFAMAGHRHTSVRVTDGQISGYDSASGTHFFGSNGQNGLLNFYDYETCSHVHLTLNDSHFRGYDYHTSGHFSGTVNGNSISIYDHQCGGHFHYTV